MSDPTNQYNIDLKLPREPFIKRTDPGYDDIYALYKATQILAQAIEDILIRLTAAGIP